MQRISVRISVVKSMPPPQTPTADGSVRLHRVWPGWFGTDVANTFQLQACVKRPHHMAVWLKLLPTLSLRASIASEMDRRPRLARWQHGTGGGLRGGAISTRIPVGPSSTPSSGLGVSVRRTAAGVPSSQLLVCQGPLSFSREEAQPGQQKELLHQQSCNN